MADQKVVQNNNSHSIIAENSTHDSPKSRRVEPVNKVSVILGAQWGDEGKGKLVDVLAQESDVVCRCVPQEQKPVIPRALKRSSDSIGSSTTDVDASSAAKKKPQQIPTMSKREENVDTNTHNENAKYVAQEDDGYGSAVSLSPPIDKNVVNTHGGNSEIQVSGDLQSFSGDQHHTKGDHLHVGQMNFHGPVILHGGALKESLLNPESLQLKKFVKELVSEEVCKAQDSVEGGVDRRAVKYPVKRELKYESPEAASCDGKHVWTIANFSQLKEDVQHGKDVSLFSQPFYTSRLGYKMCVKLCLHVGDGMGKEVTASLFFVVMQGEFDAVMPWPFRQKVTLMVLDQDSSRQDISHSFQPDPNSCSFKRPTTEMSIASDSGCQLDIDHKVLEDSSFLKDDVILVKVEVDTTGLEAFDESVHEDHNEIKKTMIKLLQDKQDMMDARLKRLEHGGLLHGNRGQHSVEQTDRMARGSEGVSNARMVSVENQIAEHNIRFQFLETANYEGELLWKIKDFTRRKRDANSDKTSLYSQPFYTSRNGYKMCARIYLNGYGMGKGTHASLFFVVMRGDYDALLPWPFRQKVTLMLLDQATGQDHISNSFRPDPDSSSFHRPTTDMNIASGCPLHIDHKVLEDSTYLKDDVIFVKVVVDTRDIPRT